MYYFIGKEILGVSGTLRARDILPLVFCLSDFTIARKAIFDVQMRGVCCC